MMSASTVQSFALETPSVGIGVSIDTEDSSQPVPVTLTAEPLTFSVTLPASLPIAVDSTGKVFTADNAVITNNSSADVSINNLEIKAVEGWTLADFDTYSTQDGVMAMRIDSVKTTGSDTTDFTPSSFEPITKSGGTVDLPYDAKLPTFYDATSVQVANAIFTIGWADEASNEASIKIDPDIPFVDGKYEIVTLPDGDLNFSVEDNNPDHTWNSSNTGVIKIDSDTGVGIVVGNGDTTIDYESPDVDFSVDVSVNLPSSTYYPVMKSWATNRTGDFHDYLRSITSMQIVDYQEVPDRPVHGPWDISEVKDGSVMAWMPTTSSVVISGNGSGGIKAPVDASYMFNGMVFLTSFEGLQYLDTSNTTNMYRMFGDMGEVLELDLSSLDTSSVTNMSYLFVNSKIASLNMSNWDTSGVTDMSYMFDNMPDIEVIDISGFDTSSVRTMCRMFSNSPSLISLNLSGLDTSACTDMNYMFSRCTSLKELDLRSFDTSHVTDMSNMFAGSTLGNMNLKKIDLSSFDTSSVTNMYEMFAYSNIEELNLSNFETENVESFYRMFYNCDLLKSLDVSNWDLSSATTVDFMFGSCDSLVELDLSTWDIPEVVRKSAMFAWSNALETIYCKTQDDYDILITTTSRAPDVNFIIKSA